jgi:hypothetical protein
LGSVHGAKSRFDPALCIPASAAAYRKTPPAL